MVAPTGTLPKSTAEGLELSTAEEEVVEASAAAATEVPLALVMPVQPDSKNADNRMINKGLRRIEAAHPHPRTFLSPVFRCEVMVRQV